MQGYPQKIREGYEDAHPHAHLTTWIYAISFLGRSDFTIPDINTVQHTFIET